MQGLVGSRAPLDMADSPAGEDLPANSQPTSTAPMAHSCVDTPLFYPRKTLPIPQDTS